MLFYLIVPEIQFEITFFPSTQQICAIRFTGWLLFIHSNDESNIGSIYLTKDR